MKYLQLLAALALILLILYGGKLTRDHNRKWKETVIKSDTSSLGFYEGVKDSVVPSFIQIPAGDTFRRFVVIDGKMYKCLEDSAK